jgi:hypothetical protein
MDLWPECQTIQDSPWLPICQQPNMTIYPSSSIDRKLLSPPEKHKQS